MTDPLISLVWTFVVVGFLALLLLVQRGRQLQRRPRHFTQTPPVEVRAAFDRRGELWLREDDAGTYWTSRGLRCHVSDLLASRGPLVEVPDATWRK